MIKQWNLPSYFLGKGSAMWELYWERKNRADTAKCTANKLVCDHIWHNPLGTPRHVGSGTLSRVREPRHHYLCRPGEWIFFDVAGYNIGIIYTYIMWKKFKFELSSQVHINPLSKLCFSMSPRLYDWGGTIQLKINVKACFWQIQNNLSCSAKWVSASNLCLGKELWPLLCK